MDSRTGHAQILSNLLQRHHRFQRWPHSVSAARFVTDRVQLAIVPDEFLAGAEFRIADKVSCESFLLSKVKTVNVRYLSFK
jgi:hypothetical protein